MQYEISAGAYRCGMEKMTAIVTVDGVSIERSSLKPLRRKCFSIGTRSKDGRWCLAVYEIPSGSRVVFKATAAGMLDKVESFTVGDAAPISCEGYTCLDRFHGWIRELGVEQLQISGI